MRLEKSGILVIDKPPGMSSAQAVAEIKKVSGARKVGHAGTLDPPVSYTHLRAHET